MQQKTIVITGASDGIGRVAAGQLSRHGHSVLVVGRSPERSDPHDDSGNGRVMLVDDDVESTASLAVVLELGGFEVAQANDLNEALRVAESFMPDLVVMDLAMPGADGYEVVRRLRALPALAHTTPLARSSGDSWLMTLYAPRTL